VDSSISITQPCEQVTETKGTYYMMAELQERILLRTQIDIIRDITGYANDMGEKTARIHKAQWYWYDCLVNI